MISNKSSHSRIGASYDIKDWGTTSKHLQDQSGAYEYKAIGKHEKTSHYTNTKLTIGKAMSN